MSQPALAVTKHSDDPKLGRPEKNKGWPKYPLKVPHKTLSFFRFLTVTEGMKRKKRPSIGDLMLEILEEAMARHPDLKTFEELVAKGTIDPSKEAPVEPVAKPRRPRKQ